MASFRVAEPAVTGRTSAPSSFMRKTLGDWRSTSTDAHEDDAGNVEQRAGRGGGHAMLAGAGLGDDARLAHALGQQHLAQHVVDLVRAGVVQLVALEVDLGAAQLLGQALGEIERAGPAGIVLQQIVEFVLERRIGLGRVVGLLQLEDQRHQRFGDIAAAENAEMAALVGAGAETVGKCGSHGLSNREGRA